MSRQGGRELPSLARTERPGYLVDWFRFGPDQICSIRAFQPLTHLRHRGLDALNSSYPGPRTMPYPKGEAMKRRSRASGKSAKARRQKAVTPKRSNASKVMRRGSSASTGEETEIARLRRQ